MCVASPTEDCRSDASLRACSQNDTSLLSATPSTSFTALESGAEVKPPLADSVLTSSLSTVFSCPASIVLIPEVALSKMSR